MKTVKAIQKAFEQVIEKNFVTSKVCTRFDSTNIRINVAQHIHMSDVKAIEELVNVVKFMNPNRDCWMLIDSHRTSSYDSITEELGLKENDSYVGIFIFFGLKSKKK